MIVGILPTITTSTCTPTRCQRQPALQAAQRADLRRPRGGPAHRDRRRRAAVDLRRHDRPRGRVHERPAAPAGRSRRRSPRTGTPPRRSPASSSRSAPTRRSSSAASCGARRGSRSSSRRPTRARRSSRPRACARACGSASAGSPRSSTSSRRTSATSRRCCRCATTRTRSAVLERGDTPRLQELRLHNGTIYRWNRPVYDVVRGRPHLRVENRVLPAGPTVVDTLANAAFYYGLVRVLADDERPIWSQMSFAAAEENFHAVRARRHRRARVLAGRRRGAGRRARAAPAAADGPRGPRALGRATPPTPTGCSRSSSAAASLSATAPRGRPRPSTGSTRAASSAARRCADDRALPRAHALQRARPHLARR